MFLAFPAPCPTPLYCNCGKERDGTYPWWSFRVRLPPEGTVWAQNGWIAVVGAGESTSLSTAAGIMSHAQRSSFRLRSMWLLLHKAARWDRRVTASTPNATWDGLDPRRMSDGWVAVCNDGASSSEGRAARSRAFRLPY
jgi:hypothetical protein